MTVSHKSKAKELRKLRFRVIDIEQQRRALFEEAVAVQKQIDAILEQLLEDIIGDM